MKVRKHLILFCRSFLGWELSRARRKGGGVKSSGAETTPSTQADSTLVNVYQVEKLKEETSVLSVPLFLLPLLFAKLCSAPAQETPVKQDQVLSYFHEVIHIFIYLPFLLFLYEIAIMQQHGYWWDMSLKHYLVPNKENAASERIPFYYCLFSIFLHNRKWIYNHRLHIFILQDLNKIANKAWNKL